MKDWPAIEQTVEFEVRGGAMVRLWLDRSCNALEMSTHVRTEIEATMTYVEPRAVADWCAEHLKGLTAVQVSKDAFGVRYGCVIYTVWP